jgi:hypothetical protein
VRVRDIIHASLDLIVSARLLPPYSHAGCDDETMLTRYGSVFTAKDIKVAKLSESGRPFGGDDDAWRDAFDFVKHFTAGSAARSGTTSWPGNVGPFAVKASEIYEHICYALQSAKLSQVAGSSKLLKGTFEATETLAVKKLPDFYGHYLVRQGQLNPWDRNIDLRLRIELGVQPRPAGAVGTLTMSAPAASVVGAVEAELGSVPALAVPSGSPAPSATHALLNLLATSWRRPLPFP